jgi:hypothetical protein
MKKGVYTTYDKVEIFEGDNFYLLYDNGKNYPYCIKFWDAKLMQSLFANRQYLKDKLLFSSKEAIKQYIVKFNVITNNFHLVFRE